MNATTKVKLTEITPNLSCKLCNGYFIDATTIIECLHSFCKSCIVKHLEKSEYCPVCDVQLHSSKPLSSIRSDQMLQEIVYKLVPGLFQNEMENRRRFYKEKPDSKPVTQMDSGHVYNESYISSDDIIHLSLEYQTPNAEFRESTKRFIKCPAAVSIGILKKLLQGKFDLSNEATIEIMYGERILPDDFLLMDIAYKYSWTQNGKPLQLCYRVKGDASIFKTVKLQKFEDEDIPTSTVHSSMPVTNAQNTEYINSNNSDSDLTINTTKVPLKKVLNSDSPMPMSTPTTKRRQSRGTKTTPLDSTDSDISTNNSKAKSKKLTNGLVSNIKVLNSKPKGISTRKSLPATLDLNSDKEADTSSTPLRGRPKRKSLSLAEQNEKTNGSGPTSTAKNGPVKTKRQKLKDKITMEIKDKEVQLRISENGVICARNASGEEKIIGVGSGAVGKGPPVSVSANNSYTNSETNTTPGAESSPHYAVKNRNQQQHLNHLMIPQIAASHIIGLNSPISGAFTTPSSSYDNKAKGQQTSSTSTTSLSKTKNSKQPQQQLDNKYDTKIKTRSPRISKKNVTNNNLPLIGADADKTKLLRIGTKRKLSVPPVQATNPKVPKSKLAQHFGTSTTLIGRNNKFNKKNSNMETLKSVTKRLQDELDAQVSYFAAEITPIINTNGSSSSSYLQNQSQSQQTTLHTTNNDNTLNNLSVKGAEIQSQNFPNSSLFSSKLPTTTASTVSLPSLTVQQMEDKRHGHHQSLMMNDVNLNVNTKYSMSTPTKQKQKEHALSSSSSSPATSSASKVKILPKMSGKDSPLQQSKRLLPSSSPNSSPKKPPKFFKSRHTSAGVQSDISLSAPKTSVNFNTNSRLGHGYVGVTSESLENQQQSKLVATGTGTGTGGHTHGHSPLLNGTGGSTNINKTPSKTSSNEMPSPAVTMSVPTMTVAQNQNNQNQSLASSIVSLSGISQAQQYQAQAQSQNQQQVSMMSNAQENSMNSSNSPQTALQGHIISQGQGQAQTSYRYPLSMGMNFPNGIPMSLVPFFANSYQQGSLPFFSTSLATPANSNVSTNTTANTNSSTSTAGGQKNISIPSMYAHPYFDYNTAAQIQSLAQVQNINNMNNLNMHNLTMNLNGSSVGMGNMGQQHNIQEMSFAKLNSGDSTATTNSNYSNLLTTTTSQQQQYQQQQNNQNPNNQNNINNNTQIQIPVPSSIPSFILPAPTSSGHRNPENTNTIFISNLGLTPTTLHRYQNQKSNEIKNLINSVNTSSSSINSNTITYSSGSSVNPSISNKSLLARSKPTENNNISEPISITGSLLAAQNLMVGIHNIGRGGSLNVSNNFHNQIVTNITPNANSNTINSSKPPRKSNSPTKIGRLTNVNDIAGASGAGNGIASSNMKSVPTGKVKTPNKNTEKLISTSSSTTIITTSITGTGGTPRSIKLDGISSATPALVSNMKPSVSVTSASSAVGVVGVGVSSSSLAKAQNESNHNHSHSNSVSADYINVNVDQGQAASSSSNTSTSMANTIKSSLSSNKNTNFVAIYSNKESSNAELNTISNSPDMTVTSTSISDNNNAIAQQLLPTTSDSGSGSTETNNIPTDAQPTENNSSPNPAVATSTNTKVDLGQGSNSNVSHNHNYHLVSNDSTNIRGAEKIDSVDAEAADAVLVLDSGSTDQSQSQNTSNSNDNVSEVSERGSNLDQNVNGDGPISNSNGDTNVHNEEENVTESQTLTPTQCFNINNNVNNNILPKESSAVAVGTVSPGAQNIHLTNVSSGSVSMNMDVSVSQTENSSTPSA